MGQSKLGSATEAALNTASGFIISYAATFIVFPLAGMHSTASQNLVSVISFTAISVVRSYVWRRVFNRIHNGKKF